jgi:CubicO group peptidase (beta-lactamase class C family)/tetratricopeptide (TPR) repeat protein
MRRPTQRIILFVYLIVSVWAQSLSAQTDDRYTEQIEKFEQFVAQQMKSDRIPGISIGFMKDDFVWTKGFGYADLENESRAKAESAYRLASVTKPMTAIAVLQLVEKGKIDLEAEVQAYVSYFPKKQWPVKVGLVLGHLGGISHYRNYDLEGHFKDHKDTREAIAVFEDFELVAEPGTRYQYSSYGYNLLGAVIEAASGQSYGDYMRENIWGPLGMDATTMDDPVDIIPNRVRGYRTLGGQIKNSEFVDISSRFAAGGTRSTVGDLLRFAAGLKPGVLLSAESLDKMWTSMAIGNGRFTNYGMGWGISQVNGRFWVSHTGGQAETSTRLEYYPDDNFAIAIGCNLEGGATSPYARKLYQLILGAPWDISAYSGSKADDAILNGMNDVFGYGLSYFESHDAPSSSDKKDIERAFAYFNQTVNRVALEASYDETAPNIRNGRHPVAHQAFVKIGSHMAAKISEKSGMDRLNAYHTAGAIPFFADYISLYKGQRRYSKKLKFSESFEVLIANWNDDWEKTWNDYTQHLILSASFDLEEVGSRLRESFADASVYPNFSPSLGSLIRQFYVQGNAPKAFAAAQMANELYPNSDQTNVYYGVGLLAMGQVEEGSSYIRKASEINSNGVAGPGGLNSFAYNLLSAGAVDLGLQLLKIAVELYPKVANLYDSIGEFYLNKEMRDESIAWYKKAIEVDPDFENAKRMLKQIMAEK